MRVLVTGANGFIGSNIVAELLAAGNKVICAVRRVSETQQRFPECDVISVDFNHSAPDRYLLVACCKVANSHA